MQQLYNTYLILSMYAYRYNGSYAVAEKSMEIISDKP